ncbi:MAG: hypothetical protein ACJ75G_11170 [Gaiellaceae bacterium]
MLTWLWIVALYVLGIGMFRWLGGLASAADAFSRWGRATAERRRHAVSSSS